VLFAGLTVVISLLGMFMMNLDTLRSVAAAAALAVLFDHAASVTLLPALLGFVASNIDRLGLPHRAPGEARHQHHVW
jgi:putative drug exporter of the RND superfamily